VWVFCDECGSMLRPTQRRCPVCRQHPGVFANAADEPAAARWLATFVASLAIAGIAGAVLVTALAG